VISESTEMTQRIMFLIPEATLSELLSGNPKILGHSLLFPSSSQSSFTTIAAYYAAVMFSSEPLYLQTSYSTPSLRNTAGAHLVQELPI
jgi:hypothetical protein